MSSSSTGGVACAPSPLNSKSLGCGIHAVPSFTVLTEINRPVHVCFDLARDVEVHCQTAAFTGERAVVGRTSGLLEAGDVVTFHGRRFRIRARIPPPLRE